MQKGLVKSISEKADSTYGFNIAALLHYFRLNCIKITFKFSLPEPNKQSSLSQEASSAEKLRKKRETERNRKISNTASQRPTCAGVALSTAAANYY